MLWNCDSLGSYTKRSFLIEQLYTYDIQVALIQETMLIKKNKLFIKGYKTYRAEGNIRRKGVLTLISEQMDASHSKQSWMKKMEDSYKLS